MLEKLKIIGLRDSTESSIAVPFAMYIAMFNPEKFSVSNQAEYKYDYRPGGTGSVQIFDKISPRSFSFEFLIDGTGASGEMKVVDAEIKLFKLTVGYIGDTHHPAYLIINWGTFVVRCVLKSLTVNYTLFNPVGIPLRATINASFALQLNKKYGSITVGKVASVFITKPIPSIAYLPYAFGSHLVDQIILQGREDPFRL